MPSSNGIIPDLLLWLGFSALALVLLFFWLFYQARGGRAVKVGFSGFGMSVNIASAPTKVLEQTEDKA